jgi:hypothetical protein
MIIAAFTYGTVEELLEVAFSVQSMPRLYNEEQLPLQNSLESVVSECSSQTTKTQGIAFVRRLTRQQLVEAVTS